MRGREIGREAKLVRTNVDGTTFGFRKPSELYMDC